MTLPVAAFDGPRSAGDLRRLLGDMAKGMRKHTGIPALIHEVIVAEGLRRLTGIAGCGKIPPCA